MQSIYKFVKLSNPKIKKIFPKKKQKVSTKKKSASLRKLKKYL